MKHLSAFILAVWAAGAGVLAQTPLPEAQIAAPPEIAPISNRFYGLVIYAKTNLTQREGVPRKPGVTVAPELKFLQGRKFARLFETYRDKEISLETTIRSLQANIILLARQHGQPLVDVIWEEQEFSNGMLQLVVLEGRLGEKLVVKKTKDTNLWAAYPEPGRKWFERNIKISQGERITSRRVDADLDWLNRNPFRTVELEYVPAAGLTESGFGKSDIILNVREEKPWTVRAGYENTGDDLTGEHRWSVGFDWGRAFGLRDNVLSYTFTADPTLDNVRAHSATYEFPLPWRHLVRLLGAYADVKGEGGPLFPDSTIEGKGYQAGLRYGVPLPLIGKFKHELSFGADFKSSDNALLFTLAGVQDVNTPTEVLQAAAGYSALFEDGLGRNELGLQAYYSPGDVTEKNSDENFNDALPGAEANYTYGRIHLARETWLPLGLDGFRSQPKGRRSASLLVKAGGQVASGNLIPSEALALGGAETIRGYQEREASGSKGWYVSGELRSPRLPLPRIRGIDHEIQLLGFVDYGFLSNYDNVAGSSQDSSGDFRLFGAGGGLRYAFGRYLSVRFDYGVPLRDSNVTGIESKPRAHVGVEARF